MIDQFLQSKALAPNTERSYRYSLTMLAVSPLSTRDDLLEALDGQRALGVKITALKSYYGWLQESGQRLDDPTKGLKLPRITPSVGKGLNPEELQGLYSALKTDREKALIGLLFGSGLRANEVIALNWGDLRWDEVLIHKAKHGSTGCVPMSKMTIEALEALPKAESTDPIFVSESNRSLGQRLSYTGLHLMVKQMGERVGIQGLTPHDGRHTFIHGLVKSGMDAFLATSLTRQKDIRSYTVYADAVRYETAKAQFQANNNR